MSTPVSKNESVAWEQRTESDPTTVGYRERYAMAYDIARNQVVLFGGALYFSEDHQQYLVFAANRDAWHQRCDVYIGKRPAQLSEDQVPKFKACAEDMAAMIAYGKRQGWME